MPDNQHSFLGSGFPFPLQWREGALSPCCGEEKIKQSIYAILMTRPGERAARPDFGCGIWDYVFELPSETYRNLMQAEIVGAINRWEHRVTQVSAAIDCTGIAQGKLLVSLHYMVRATNRPDNLVFPFYLEEGQW